MAGQLAGNLELHPAVLTRPGTPPTSFPSWTEDPALGSPIPVAPGFGLTGPKVLQGSPCCWPGLGTLAHWSFPGGPDGPPEGQAPPLLSGTLSFLSPPLPEPTSLPYCS